MRRFIRFIDDSNRMLTGFFASQTGVVEIGTDNPVFRAEQGYGDEDHVARAGQEYLSGYHARRVAEHLGVSVTEARS